MTIGDISTGMTAGDLGIVTSEPSSVPVVGADLGTALTRTTALADLAGAGYRLIVVTNQSGLARGLLTEEALERLQTQFRERRVTKEYHALVMGDPRFDSDWIDKPLGRDPKRPDRIQVLRGGRKAETLS